MRSPAPTAASCSSKARKSTQSPSGVTHDARPFDCQRFARANPSTFSREPKMKSFFVTSRQQLGERFHNLPVIGIDIGKRLTVRVLDDEAAGDLLNGPRWWKAAL